MREVFDVFFEKLSGLLPERAIEFVIDVQPGIDSISIPPYRIALVKLKELETQLRELLNKGFV